MIDEWNLPLNYFEKILSDKFILYSEALEIYSYDSIPEDKLIATGYKDEDGLYRGSREHGGIRVFLLLIPKLIFEIENSKEKILNIYNQNQNYTFLDYQFNSIQQLINNNFEIINSHPYLIIPFRQIIDFINLLLPTSREKYILNEDKLKQIPIDAYDSMFKKDFDIINDALSYFNPENNNKNILSKEDFRALNKYSLELILKKKIPKIEMPLSPKGISKDLITFTFWVIFKEIYHDKHKIPEYYIEFIRQAFSKFNNDSHKSIRSHFGAKSRVKNDNFLPEIIKKHLKSERN